MLAPRRCRGWGAGQVWGAWMEVIACSGSVIPPLHRSGSAFAVTCNKKEEEKDQKQRGQSGLELTWMLLLLLPGGAACVSRY
eukprot:497179-Rhodomonas_salina.1